MSWTEKITVSLLAVCLSASGMVACAGGPQLAGQEERFAHPVSVTEAVKLSQAGVDPEVIVYKMNLSGIVYNLTDEQYERIRSQGVTPRVIDYMRSTYDQAVASHPRLADDEYLACWYLGWDGAWYGGGPQGFHPACRKP